MLFRSRSAQRLQTAVNLVTEAETALAVARAKEAELKERCRKQIESAEREIATGQSRLAEVDREKKQIVAAIKKIEDDHAAAYHLASQEYHSAISTAAEANAAASSAAAEANRVAWEAKAAYDAAKRAVEAAMAAVDKAKDELEALAKAKSCPTCKRALDAESV